MARPHAGGPEQRGEGALSPGGGGGASDRGLEVDRLLDGSDSVERLLRQVVELLTTAAGGSRLW
jgi:hypothetical protein